MDIQMNQHYRLQPSVCLYRKTHGSLLANVPLIEISILIFLLTKTIFWPFSILQNS